MQSPDDPRPVDDRSGSPASSLAGRDQARGGLTSATASRRATGRTIGPLVHFGRDSSRTDRTVSLSGKASRVGRSCQVVELGRVAQDVVKLGPAVGIADVGPASGDDGLHRPSPGGSTGEILRHLVAKGDLGESGRRGRTGRIRSGLPVTSQGFPRKRRVEGVPCQVHERRRQVAQADRFIDDATCRTAPGCQDHQGDMHLLAVQASAMAEESMLAHLLAVIRGDDDHGIVEQAAALQRPPSACRSGSRGSRGSHRRRRSREWPHPRARSAWDGSPSPARVRARPGSPRGARSFVRSLRAPRKASGHRSN